MVVKLKECARNRQRRTATMTSESIPVLAMAPVADMAPAPIPATTPAVEEG